MTSLYGGKGNDTLYGGKGSDTFEVWTSAAYASSSYETSTDTIMDFTTGTDGDTLAIPTGWFTNYSAGSNPFTTGHARLTQSGSDTLLELDMDGTGSGSFQTAMILKNVTKTNLVASNLNGFNPAVILPTYSLAANATSANEGTNTTFTLTTTNVANGTVLPYVLSGTINSSDIAGGSLTGNVTVNNNTATITVGLVADAATEGAEILTASITGTTASATTSVSDTSPSSTTGAPMFTEYNTTTHTTNDLLTHLVSSTSTTGVQFSAANLIGAPAQVSMFESLNLSSTLTMGKGVLLTSGDGTPPESSTSSRLRNFKVRLGRCRHDNHCAPGVLGCWRHPRCIHTGVHRNGDRRLRNHTGNRSDFWL
ncbi:MAG: hypothetical protein IPH37_15555 [Burkholderiales bacterium]|nr:hypothetical protein [Burkholderiales bacterium]